MGIYDKQEPDETGVEPEINSMPTEVQDVAHFFHSNCEDSDLGLWLRVLGEEMDDLSDYQMRKDQHGPDNFCEDCIAGDDGEWVGCHREKQAIATVTILAGIPGSGKSHVANEMVHESCIVSTDDFWTKDGEYAFDPKRITEAHGWNFIRFLKMLDSAARSKGGDGTPPHIVVDNTNTTIAELAPYYAAAQARGADVKVIAVLCPWQVAAARQQHGLPAAKVYQMSLRLEETLRSFPAWWSLDVADNTPHPGWTPEFG